MSLMKYENLNWCLFNVDTEQVIEGLSWQQFRAFVKTIDKADYKLWHFWHEKLTHWQTIGEIAQAAFVFLHCLQSFPFILEKKG